MFFGEAFIPSRTDARHGRASGRCMGALLVDTSTRFATPHDAPSLKPGHEERFEYMRSSAMSHTRHSRQTAQNHPPTTHDVCDHATGDRIGEVDHATYMRYLDELEGLPSAQADMGAVDGADYGFEGYIIYIED